MAQVYVGLQNQVLEKIVKDVSKSLGLQAFHYADIKNAKHEDIVFVDNFYVKKMNRSFEHVILLSDLDFEESFDNSLQHSNISLVQAVDSHNFHWEVTKLLEQILESELFTLRDYLQLNQNSEVLNIHMRSFSEVESYIDKAIAFLQIDDYRNLANRFRQVAHEIIMNAFFDSQKDTSGEQLHFHTERDVELKVPEDQLPILTIAQDANFIGLAVRDHFGSLEFADLKQSLEKCLGQEEGLQLREAGAGAGIGLYMCCTTASRTIFNVTPGKFTEVISLLYKTRRNLEPKGTAPSFAFFQREAA